MDSALDTIDEPETDADPEATFGPLTSTIILWRRRHGVSVADVIEKRGRRHRLIHKAATPADLLAILGRAAFVHGLYDFSPRPGLLARVWRRITGGRS